jgi:hypothetical protein
MLTLAACHHSLEQNSQRSDAVHHHPVKWQWEAEGLVIADDNSDQLDEQALKHFGRFLELEPCHWKDYAIQQFRSPPGTLSLSLELEADLTAAASQLVIKMGMVNPRSNR